MLLRSDRPRGELPRKPDCYLFCYRSEEKTNSRRIEPLLIVAESSGIPVVSRY